VNLGPSVLITLGSPKAGILAWRLVGIAPFFNYHYVMCRMWLLFPLIVCVTSVSACWATTSSCRNAPRTVGPFGAENTPRAPIPLSAEVRAQLPGLVSVTDLLDTRLSPSGEQVVVYSTDEDESNPHPKIAFIASGRVKKILAATEISSAGGGFWRYLSGCEYQVMPKQNGLALAFTTGFDGAASVFAVVIWKSKNYSVVFNPLVGQGRMVLSLGELALWGSDGTGECIWCEQHYRVTNYRWRGGAYFETTSTTLLKMFDPAEVSSIPLMIANAGEKP
jgi:hypothetical protein